MNETVALSRIYRKLVDEFEAQVDVRLRDAQKQRMIEHVSEAVSAAVGVLTARCPTCDSKDITIVCGNCVTEELKVARNTLGAQRSRFISKREM